MIAEYIASVLAESGFEPIQAASLSEARRWLGERRFDLWLCDRHLPDGDSSALLGERDSDSRHRDTPAIALTAELNTDTRHALLAAGFADALAKPCSPDRLRDSVHRHLDPGTPLAALGPTTLEPDAPAAAVLDDSAALPVCGGDPATLAAMRRLFAGDLPAICQRLDAQGPQGDPQTLRDELHRLAASTAWCGALEAGERARGLRTALETNRDIAPAFAALMTALARLTNALNERMPAGT